MLSDEQRGVIRRALDRRNRCLADAEFFREAYARVRNHAYSGDAHNDPAEDAEMVAVLTSLDVAIGPVQRMSLEIRATLTTLPGWAEYIAELDYLASQLPGSAL